MGIEVGTWDMEKSELKNMQELTQYVQGLLQALQDKFQNMSDTVLNRIDDMGTRIDDLEKNISELMTQPGGTGYDGPNVDYHR